VATGAGLAAAETCQPSFGAWALSLLCFTGAIYAAAALIDTARVLWRRHREGLPLSRAGTVSAWIGLYPIVTLEKQVPNMIANLV
jgi:hypothetical protein